MNSVTNVLQWKITVQRRKQPHTAEKQYTATVYWIEVHYGKYMGWHLVRVYKYGFWNTNQMSVHLFPVTHLYSLHKVSWDPDPVLSQSVHRKATYRCDDIRDCIMQFFPPDTKHMCWKHVEAWNKVIIKFSASSLWILINKSVYNITG